MKVHLASWGCRAAVKEPLHFLGSSTTRGHKAVGAADAVLILHSMSFVFRRLAGSTCGAESESGPRWPSCDVPQKGFAARCQECLCFDEA